LSHREYVLSLSCPDRPGIVYTVSSFLVQHSANILASQQYGEPPAGRFFMRVHFTLPPPGVAAEVLERDFCWVAESFHMSWQLHDVQARVRTLSGSEVASRSLLALDRLEQRLEVALSEALAPLALDHLEEQRGTIAHWSREDLE